MDYKGIFLSGLPGAGKTTLVKKLSEIYGWPVLSVGDMWRAKWIKKYPGKEIPFEEYWRTTSIQENLEADRDFASRAMQGKVIGDSRFATHLLKGLPVLLVFLTVDIETRAARALGLEKYKGDTHEKIREILLCREIDEAAMSKRLYGYDYRDPSNYHLVLNTGMFSQEEEIAIMDSLIKKGDNCQ